MIRAFEVQNFKALKDVRLSLTPIHVLIGPNDSGKTSILEAVAALCRSVDHSLEESFAGKWSGRDLVWQHEKFGTVDFHVYGAPAELAVYYRLRVNFRSSGRSAVTLGESITLGAGKLIEFNEEDNLTWVCRSARQDFRSNSNERGDKAKHVYDLLRGVQIYRWIPRFLSLPNAPHSARQFRMEPSGFGLALCLDDIIGYDRKLFEKLEARFRAIFPEVEIIRLLPESAFLAPPDDSAEVPELRRADGKGIYFQLAHGGPQIPASQASDGMLLILAYLTILHLPQPPRVLLVEEPENGIHPARLKEVLSILRDLIHSQQHTQIVLTTHSPYVVDLFKPEEVTLCFKDEEGAVQTRRLSKSKAVREQIDVFTLGEIWTGDGDERLMERVPGSEDAGE